MRLIFILFVCFILSCKERNTSNEKGKLIQIADVWDNFRQKVLTNEPINWNELFQIEGQFGEDYAHLFLNEAAKEQLEKTTFDQLTDFDFYGHPVKVFSYVSTFEKEKHTFYLKIEDNELKIIGYLVSNY